MTYITKQYPIPRTYDTIIGKVMGYLAELDFYLEREQACIQIYALCSPINWYPLSLIPDFLANIQKWMYSQNYQTVYNQGADKGNDINKQILGWMDGLKTDYLTKIADAKALLQKTIDDLRAKLNALGIDITNFESRINTIMADFNTKVNDAIKKVNDTITRMDTLTKQAQAKFTEFNNALTTQYNTFKTKTDILSKDVINLDERVKALESKIGVPPKTYEGKTIWDILKEMLGI